MRSLAMEAGTLAAVGRALPPAQVTSGGVHAVLARRLQRVPEAAQPLLRRAAVAGRQLDLALLGMFAEELETWLQTGAEVGVLELYGERWRFSHDKLRETLLAQLDPAELRTLHLEVAEALARLRGDSNAAAALAYHYGHAGVPERAAYYAAMAGEQAVQRGALAEAVPLLTQALQQGGTAPPLRTYRLLVSALFALGRMAECTAVLRRALAASGEPLPGEPLPLGLALTKQLAVQLLHRSHPRFIKPPAQPGGAEALEEINLLFGVGMELFAWLGAPLETAYSILASLNLAERHGDRSILINSYAAVGFLLSLTPLTKLAERYIARGRALLAHPIDPLREVGFYRATLAAALNLGAVNRIDPADLPRAMSLSQQRGDLYAQMFLLTVQTQLEWLAGADEAARTSLHALIEMARRSDHVMELVVGKLLEAAQSLQQGRHAEVVAALNELSLHAHREGLEGYIQLSDALRALCLMREGEATKARAAADRALAMLAGAPITTSLAACCMPALVETYLELWQHAPTAAQREALAPQIRRALQALRRVAATVRIAGPSSLLLEGRYQWLRGQTASARHSFGKSQELAAGLGLHRDAVRASAWLGRATSGLSGRLIVEAAHRRMVALGAKCDAEHCRKWLET